MIEVQYKTIKKEIMTIPHVKRARDQRDTFNMEKYCQGIDKQAVRRLLPYAYAIVLCCPLDLWPEKGGKLQGEGNQSSMIHLGLCGSLHWGLRSCQHSNIYRI